MEPRYRKTEAGQREVGDKGLGLPPRMRSLLILVDGQKDRAQLRSMLGTGTDDALAQLLSKGLIAELPGSPPSNSAPRQRARAAAPAAPASTEDRAREAVRVITDLLGPDGDRLALLLERAKSLEDLQAALEKVADVLDATTTKATAEGFRRRFLG